MDPVAEVIGSETLTHSEPSGFAFSKHTGFVHKVLVPSAQSHVITG